ncbi:MAG: FAD binding domain-containing protein, partial [Actinomycetota bacterium]|nr:FAD binding domain-containing protein [Actinomycetota bacterium]
MKPPPFRYLRPKTLDEALAALEAEGPEAKALAGGQSLVPLLNMRFARPTAIIDINRVRELEGFAEEDGSLRVGALVRQSAPELLQVPLLAQCLPHVGHFVTRNRGTVGGSIAHADASAELPLALTTLAGSVVVESREGRRTIAADDFFVTHFTTTVAPGELVVATLWPRPAPGSGFAFEELAQRAGDYALSMAACALTLEDGRVAGARVAVGSVTDRPTVLAEPSSLLV